MADKPTLLRLAEKDGGLCVHPPCTFSHDGITMIKFSTLLIVSLFVLLSTISAKAIDPLKFDAVSKIDLTHTFNMPTKWSLVITHEQDDSGISQVVGTLHFCFLNDGKNTCPDICWHFTPSLGETPSCPHPDDTGYNMFGGVSSFRSIGRARANLVVATAGWTGGGSAVWYGPIIWAYDRRSNNFERIFLAVENLNNNNEVRFIPDGPLAGDVVLDQLTSPWPYRYKIVVYQLLSSKNYVKILNYNGNTTEGDGNALAVIDAEMPEIERRLGYWKPGDPLPTISKTSIPPTCKTAIKLQKGLAWCDWSR